MVRSAELEQNPVLVLVRVLVVLNAPSREDHSFDGLSQRLASPPTAFFSFVVRVAVNEGVYHLPALVLQNHFVATVSQHKRSSLGLHLSVLERGREGSTCRVAHLLHECRAVSRDKNRLARCELKRGEDDSPLVVC